jgi:RNA polymerase sigma factor (TIGR02999 family)
MSASHEVTRLLLDWGNGNEAARDELMPLIYSELRQVAEKYLNQELPGHTLQPTALVHEAYIRLVEQTHPEWKNRAHFFAVASQVMRQVLVDHARRNRAGKRGGGARHTSLDELISFSDERGSSLLALDDALTSLELFDARKCRIIELRYFGGMTTEETAKLLGLSVATIGRESKIAETWLHREMNRAQA